MLEEEVLMFFESVESITTLFLIIPHQPISNKKSTYSRCLSSRDSRNFRMSTTTRVQTPVGNPLFYIGFTSAATALFSLFQLHVQQATDPHMAKNKNPRPFPGPPPGGPPPGNFTDEHEF